MTQMMFALSLGFAGLILALQPGHAASQCGARDRVIAQLSERFGETRRGIGMAGANAVMELYASASGSWTITVTLLDGMTCLIAAGDGFETLSEELPAKGENI